MTVIRFESHPGDECRAEDYVPAHRPCDHAAHKWMHNGPLRKCLGCADEWDAAPRPSSEHAAAVTARTKREGPGGEAGG